MSDRIFQKICILHALTQNTKGVKFVNMHETQLLDEWPAQPPSFPGPGVGLIHY